MNQIVISDNDKYGVLTIDENTRRNPIQPVITIRDSQK